MSVVRGRVVKSTAQTLEVHGNQPAPTPRVHVTPDRARRIPRLVVDAHEQATAIIEEARAAARGAQERAMTAAREDQEARFAAQFLSLRAEDARRAERDVDRSVELAAMLAERMVGAAVELDPEVVRQLARQALAEAQGARRVRITANPRDAEALRADDVGLPAQDVEIVEDPTLARGSLVLHTDLGGVDARAPVQLARLAQALRDALRAR